MMEYLVQGRPVVVPVSVRDARACSAMFVVRAAAVRLVIGYAGLDVFEPVRGRAICSLAFIRYVDSDLGPYHEFAVSFLVRAPGRDGRRGPVGAFIHRLPVDQSFTLDAGRTIWGFPKTMAAIEIGSAGGRHRCAVRQDGQAVAELLVKPGIRVPSRRNRTSIDAYSHLDGVTRRTPWIMHPTGVRSRPGGAVLRLGDHPVADELRALGLPRRAIFTSSIDRLRMTFAGAEEVAVRPDQSNHTP